MMLRSQGIPARMVVGFKTDEYNSIGQFYVARQLHAHAWVEAYFDRDQLNPSFEINDQHDEGGVWMRLDATPPDATASRHTRVTHALDFAQNLWDDYVVDMSSFRQGDTLKDLGQGSGNNPTYQSFAQRISDTIGEMRRGNVRGGVGEIVGDFSWQVAAVSMLVCMACIMLLRSAPHWVRSVRLTSPKQGRVRSSVAFYNELETILDRHQFGRSHRETPRELSARLAKHPRFPQAAEPALSRLIAFYYRLRFAASRQSHSADQSQVQADLMHIKTQLQTSAARKHNTE